MTLTRVLLAAVGCVTLRAQVISVVQETPVGVIDGTNRRFVLAHMPDPLTSVAVYRNGIRQRNCTGCNLVVFISEPSGSPVILFNVANTPAVGDTIIADYQYTSSTDCTMGGTVAGFVELIGPAGTIKCGTILPPGMGILTAFSTTGLQLAVDTAVIPTLVALQSGASLVCASASGSAVAYTCSMSPTLTAYAVGTQVLYWVPDVACGVGATLNIDILGTIPLARADASPVQTMDCPAGQVQPVWFDGKEFRLMNVQ